MLRQRFYRGPPNSLCLEREEALFRKDSLRLSLQPARCVTERLRSDELRLSHSPRTIDSSPGHRALAWRRIALRSMLCAVLTLATLWPSLYNGQPFFYPDTTAYIRGADAAFSRLTHRTSVWSEQRRDSIDSGAERMQQQPRRSLSSIEDRAVLAGRSVYYGALLYASHLGGRLWPMVVVQALAVLGSVALALAVFGSFTWHRFAIIAIVLAALTPASFFASFMLPDVFAAITILSATVLLVHGGRMRRRVLLAWVVLLSASVLFHVSHVLIALGMLILAVAYALIDRASVPARGVACIVAALVVAVGGEVAFDVAVTKLLGAPPIRPPFLTARMVADGPGYRYLAANCRTRKLAACEFVDRMPGMRPDHFLWGTDPKKDVFAVANADTRRRLGSEQYRVAWAILMSDPIGQISASLRNARTQFVLIDLHDFNYPTNERAFLASHVPEPYLGVLRNTSAWRESMPVAAMSAVVIVVALLSAVYLIGSPFRRDRAFIRDRALFAFVTCIVVGMTINAFVCGAMATPNGRYQARVIWLLPLAAMLTECRRRDRVSIAPVQRDASFARTGEPVT